MNIIKNMRNNEKKIRRFGFFICGKYWNILPHIAIDFIFKEIEIEWLCFGLYISFEKYFKENKSIKKDYSFEEVEIFIRVKGRTPSEEGDSLTQEILDEFCEKYESHKLKSGIVPLEILYDLIKEKKIRPYV